jgi:cytosine/adenosine deaminase-related metal-dependent hydrolase
MRQGETRLLPPGLVGGSIGGSMSLGRKVRRCGMGHQTGSTVREGVKPMRTKLQGGIIVGFDEGSHQLIRDGVIVWEDEHLIFVGKEYLQPVDRTIIATDRLIIPGLIDLHWHAGVRANWRLTSDHGDPQFFGAGFPNTDAGLYGASFPMPAEEAEVGATLNIMELLSSAA